MIAWVSMVVAKEIYVVANISMDPGSTGIRLNLKTAQRYPKTSEACNILHIFSKLSLNRY